MADTYYYADTTSQPAKAGPIVFWMVVLDGKTAPTKRHNTRAEAEAECERLVCREGVTGSGYVLQAVTLYVPEPRKAMQVRL